MSRLIGCLVVTLLAAAPVAAGELDKEFGAKVPVTPAISADYPATTLNASSRAEVRPAGELDAETPTQACGWRRGFGFGYGGLGFGGYGLRYTSFGFGYGGLGYGGFGYGGLGYGLGGFYGGFGGYPSCGWGGWGGWGYW